MMIIRPARRTASVQEYYFSRKLKEIAAINREKAAAGLDPVINLGIGAPDGMPPSDAIRTLTESARRSDSHAYQSYVGLDALREAGADLVFFSPLEDPRLPENIGGLYLGGGYPELYAADLSDHAAMRRQIREAVKGGLPTVAECGGFLYLQDELEDEKGTRFPMCGVFEGKGFRTGRLQRFGYQYLEAEEDSLLFRLGEKVPVHEFHYWDCTQNGGDLRSVKPDGRSWNCGYASASLYAAFPHLHLSGEQPLADRFVQACISYRDRKIAETE